MTYNRSKNQAEERKPQKPWFLGGYKVLSNETSKKTVCVPRLGKVERSIPNNRNEAFALQIIPNINAARSGWMRKSSMLYASGMMTRDIVKQIQHQCLFFVSACPGLKIYHLQKKTYVGILFPDRENFPDSLKEETT